MRSACSTLSACCERAHAALRRRARGVAAAVLADGALPGGRRRPALRLRLQLRAGLVLVLPLWRRLHPVGQAAVGPVAQPRFGLRPHLVGAALRRRRSARRAAGQPAGSALRWRLLPALGFGLGGSQTSGRRNKCPIGRARAGGMRVRARLRGRSHLLPVSGAQVASGENARTKKGARARSVLVTPSPTSYSAGLRCACCTSRWTRGSDGQRPGPPLAFAATALGIVPKKPAMSTRERILEMPVRRAVGPRTAM